MFRVSQGENLKKEDNTWKIFVGAFITMIVNCTLNISLSSEIVGELLLLAYYLRNFWIL